MTPFGRFCFNRLPFGINSAPELFHKRMNQVIEGTHGFLCIFDDILVHGKTLGEHDQNLDNTLQKLQEANLTLNKDKCESAQTSVNFVGNIVDSGGVRTDPEKVEAVLQMKTPKDQSELQ